MQNAECRISPKAVNCTRCRMQMQNAECRVGPKAVHCTRCRMQMQNAECRSGPKATAVRDVQDAGCRMRNAKLTHSQERADRVPMQDAGAECKNSPNIGRRGQKKSRTECTMQVQNTESHPRVHCVCREGLYGADALYADCMLHVSVA